jgi:hypothetical protein
MDSASTQNMDSHMAAPIFSSVKHNLPSDGVFSASAATISAVVAIPSSGNESLSLDVHSSAAAIKNTTAITFPNINSAAMVPSSDFTAGAKFPHMIVPLSNTQQIISLKLLNKNFLYWSMQMKPYLLGQGVYSYVDSSFPCPPRIYHLLIWPCPSLIHHICHGNSKIN